MGPMHGRGLQVSLGYFLLPLVLVLAGSVLYGENIEISVGRYCPCNYWRRA